MPQANNKKRWGVAFVFIWFLIGCTVHLLRAELFMLVVPPYVPYPLAVVYISGILELLGAAGLLLPAWHKAAGNGLVLLTICVTPANFYMWQHPDLFPKVSELFLSARLPFQLLFIACIWWATRPDETSVQTV